MIEQIHQRLDNVEDLMGWLVKAEQRFKVGQRVQFNGKADRHGLSIGRKGGARAGRVTGFENGFTLKVLLDGYTRPHGFHHGFFDPMPRSHRTKTVRSARHALRRLRKSKVAHRSSRRLQDWMEQDDLADARR